MVLAGTYLLNNVNQNTTGEAFALSSDLSHTLAISATSMGGGTITLQFSLDGVNNWFDIKDDSGAIYSFIEPTVKSNISLKGIFIRAVLSGATNPSNIYVKLA